jgi:hypothetical protein
MNFVVGVGDEVAMADLIIHAAFLLIFIFITPFAITFMPATSTDIVVFIH